MNANEVINTITSQLDPDEQQLLKDTINYGAWGDCDMEFRNEAGEAETVYAWGYCTNDAKDAGHFNGRKIALMFKSIYKKLCPDNHMGRFLSQCNDWWGDGSGDMLFIRGDVYKAVEEWANK